MYIKYKLSGGKGREYSIWNGHAFYTVVWYDPDPKFLVQGHYNSFTQRYFVGKVCARLVHGVRMSQNESIVGGLNSVGRIEGREREICGTTEQCLLQVMFSLNIWPRNLVQGYCTSFTQRHNVPTTWHSGLLWKRKQRSCYYKIKFINDK